MHLLSTYYSQKTTFKNMAKRLQSHIANLLWMILFEENQTYMNPLYPAYTHVLVYVCMNLVHSRDSWTGKTKALSSRFK